MSSTKISATTLKSEQNQTHYNQISNGNLPLKKRRCQPTSSSLYNNITSTTAVVNQPGTTVPCSTTPTRHSAQQQQQQNSDITFKTSLVEQLIAHSRTNNLSADEKIAALALVAAAATASETGVNTRSFTNNSNNKIVDSFTIPPIEVGNGPPPPMQQSLSTTFPTFDPTDTKPTPQQRPRINRPPLSAPIPGGCHGRTSRNFSYCRRTPCYNGSKYCKLHYQQYTMNGIENGSHMKNDIVTNDKNRFQLFSLPNSHLEGGKMSSQHNERNQQNKRFNGLNTGEVQCLATTTRGRPCAYVAVSGTKYCHLHADYDTNPAPRRGGCGTNCLQKLKLDSYPTFSCSSSQNNQSMTSDNNEAYCLATLTTMISMQNSKPISNLSTIKIVDESKPATVLSNNDVKKSMPILTSEPHPTCSLLNSIPSETWLDKKVLIGTGPLKNNIGRVMKWGNGWVTVSTNTGLGRSDPGSTEILHNRRAFELVLLSDESSALATSSKFKESKDPKSQTVEYTVGKEEDKIEEKKVYEITPETKRLDKSESTTVIQKSCLESILDSSKNNFTKALEPSTKSNEEHAPGELTLIPYESASESCTEHLRLKRELTNDICDKAEKCYKDSKNGKVSVKDLNHDSSMLLCDKRMSNVKDCNKEDPISVIECVEKTISYNAKLHENNQTTRVIKESKGDNEMSSEDLTISDNNNEQINASSYKKLSLMEELILAQTGRRVKDVDLALCSVGRTIQKPKRYEDKTLINKKRRNKQQSEEEQHDEKSWSNTSPKRKKASSSPTTKSLSLSTPIQ